MPAPRTARKKVTVAVVVVLALLIGVPIAVDVLNVAWNATSSGRTTPHPAETALGAHEQLSAHDQKVLTEFGRYPRQWNEAAAPFISDYQDPNVSARAWVADASRQVEQMRSAVMGLDRAVLSIQDDGVRATFTPVVANYRRKLDAVVTLWNAVAAGDAAAETAAATELQAAATEGQQMGRDLIDRLRPFLSNADWERLAGQ